MEKLATLAFASGACVDLLARARGSLQGAREPQVSSSARLLPPPVPPSSAFPCWPGGVLCEHGPPGPPEAFAGSCHSL